MKSLCYCCLTCPLDDLQFLVMSESIVHLRCADNFISTALNIGLKIESSACISQPFLTLRALEGMTGVCSEIKLSFRPVATITLISRF